MNNSRARVLYGEANFQAFNEDNGYYVDKTHYIPLLEKFRSPVFLRPRRFGKSLLCTTLQYYYDITAADRFETDFGDTWIGQRPTAEKNSYFVLHLDFSIVDPSGDLPKIRGRFNTHVNSRLRKLVALNQSHFPGSLELDMDRDAAENLTLLLDLAEAQGLPRFYIIIDEYDNFANQMIVGRQDQRYRQLTSEGSFLKSFFKALKEGRKSKQIGRIFITGVLPITIDDLASGYNIADFITLDPEFEAMAGFTQKEVDWLLDRIYKDYGLNPDSRPQVEEVIKSNYNGYRIVDSEGDALYNSTILMYFLEKLARFKEIPEFLTDLNLKTDISWVRRLTSSNAHRTKELVNQLTIENRLPYSKIQLRDKFDMSQFFEKSFYPISFFYLGMLTREDDYFMRLPNQNMKDIFTEYFNQIHHVDTGTLYSEMMAAFAENPDLPKLFADYWSIYISQLPEAVFASVNENFYRTTFYDLCRQFLSHLYVWRMEGSMPSGRSDLEMEGKYHTVFAADRYLMEFKYVSNAKSKGLDLKAFQPLEKDLAQLEGYHRDQCNQHPAKKIRSYLIYCFGNKGFRIFPLSECE